MVLEKTCESPLDSKEIKPVNPKGNQPWIFIGRTDAEALILWPPDENSWLIKKDPDAGKNWRQKKGVTEMLGKTESKRRGWDSWMSSPIQWTWTWANSRRWWGTGRAGMHSPCGCKDLDNWRLNNNNKYISERTWKEIKAAWVLVWMTLHAFFGIFIHTNVISPLTLYDWNTVINANHTLHFNLEHKYVVFCR